MTAKPRTPGVVYSAMSIAMLTVLGAVAFSTRQPPPPTIAEFAPNAVEKIEDAPEEQSSGTELGEGVCPPEEPDCDLPSPIPTPKAKEGESAERSTIDVPRVRKCVGEPPRQIEDPQSPPCVPYWDGDNGGATYKGVTKDEIRVGAPLGAVENVEGISDFFNRRFELYGRKFVVVDTSAEDRCGEPADARAAAQADEEQYKLFATTQGCDTSEGMYAYMDEIARRGLIYSGHESTLGSPFTRRHHPHLWQYPMEADGMFAHLGDWACGRIAGKKARHAGPLLQDGGRVFGVIFQDRFPDGALEPDELTRRLEACGAKPKVVMRDADPAANATNVILQMKNAGVTSVFCLCHILDEGVYGAAATAQGYFPEWLISTYDVNNSNGAMKIGFPAEHRENLFGIQLLPMQVSTEDRPSTWACNEVNCGEGALGVYGSMLLLASGVQMAGPNLTPETFAEGLRKTIFPNPDHPNIPGKVGFNEPVARPDPKYSTSENMPHGMTIDGIEFWWSESAEDPAGEGNGAMCYVARKRYRLGEYPKGPDAILFAGPCDNGA